MKKFIDGLLFGSGFGVAFSVIWYVAAYIIIPMSLSSKIEQATDTSYSEVMKSHPSISSISTLPEKQANHFMC